MATNFLDEAGLKELLNKISAWGEPKGSSIASISSMSGGNRIINYTMTAKSGETPKTGTFTYQDTTYSTGNASTAGLTKLYTNKVTNNNGAYSAAALSGTAANNGANLVGYDGTMYTATKLDGTKVDSPTIVNGTTVANALDHLYAETGTSEQKISDIKDKLTAIDTKLGNTTSSLSDYVLKSELAAYEANTEYGATLVGVGDLASEDGSHTISGSNLQDVLKELLDYTTGWVPTSRTINGKALTANITLAAQDIGYTATIGASPVTTVWGALDALNAAVAGGLQFAVVNALPDVESASSNVIYMVEMADSTTDSDNYEEWIKVLKTVGSGSSARPEVAWERLGSTGSLKLTDYWAKADLVAMTTAQVDSLCDANLL